MSTQMTLIRVTDGEFSQAAYRLAQLMQQKEEEVESFKEAREAHKETMAVYDNAIKQERATIRRHQLEHAEALSDAAQVEALVHEMEERRE
jgi:malic enzyme